MDNMVVDDRDVHTEHCCAKHGCKYPFTTKDCSVVSGKKKQSFPCEECHEEANEVRLSAKMQQIAGEAWDAWDKDDDSRVGKLLMALAGKRGIRPDLDKLRDLVR